MKKAGSVRQVIEALGPLVKSLLELERDLAGIERQYTGIPRDCEGPEALLDRCQRAADVRWIRLIGRAAGQQSSSPGMSSRQECRELLARLGWLAQISGAELDTAPLPATAKVWTAVDDRDPDGVFYDPIPPGAPKTFAEARYRLTTRVRLNRDGSLVNRHRNKAE